MESPLPIWTDSVSDQPLKDSETHKKAFRSPSSISDASAVANRHKSRLEPVTTHPLSQQTSTSPIVFNSNHSASSLFKKEQSLTTLCGESDFCLFSEVRGPNTIKKRHGSSDFNKITNAHSSDINELEKKKMVIVHVVKPSDTLAGVALFYGIELSIIKRANKLWTSDSIHVRKYLYIPLEHCKIIADEANVMVQENQITIMNRSSTSDSPRPSMSYERDLFTTNDYSNNEISYVRDFSGGLTSTIWSSSSSSSSPSSTSSSLSNPGGAVVSSFVNYTRAEIQQLPSAQLSYFPPHLSTTCSAKSNPTFLSSSSSSPSPMPVTYLNKNDSHVQVSFPRPTITTDSRSTTIVDKLFASAGEKYRKSFGSVKRERKKARIELWNESPISLTKKKV